MKLDVCIAAYREKGLQKILNLSHPQIEGVRYIIAWQYAQDSPTCIPPELLEREDFVIIPNDTKGTGANRKIALEHASAPLILISDDDVSYTEDQLNNLISAFEARAECDFIIGNYHSSSNPYKYPSEEFDFRDQPKGFSFGGPVTAFRLNKVREKGVEFNPLFGVNSF
ncbi:MAG: glycosyltransferase, partial [Muribaculaceae bacterium]|nr:glycosyltransferase [Muribaculaceae bacterium]